MNRWQIPQQLRHLLLQRKWEDNSSYDVIFKDVIVANPDNVNALMEKNLPLALVRPLASLGDAENDTEEPDYERSGFEILCLQMVENDALGESALIGSNRSGVDVSEGRGILEIESEVKETVNLLNGIDGVETNWYWSSVPEVITMSGRQVAAVAIRYECNCTPSRYYHPPTRFAATDGAGTEWDVANATKDAGEIDASALGAGTGVGVDISADGTKVFIGGSTARKVYSYTLSTAYDLSTAVKDAAELDTTSQVPVGTFTDIVIGDSGTEVYISSAGSPSDVYQYTLSTPYDLSSASYTGVGTTSTGSSQGITFNAAGTKIYVCSLSIVQEYPLSSAWDITSIGALANTLNIAGNGLTATALHLGNSDATLFITGINDEEVHQYTLSTPGDLSTATKDASELDVSSGVTTPEGLVFSADGSYLFISDNASRKVARWDIGGGVASLSWKAAPTRYDTLGGSTPQYVLRRASGSTAPTTPTSGTDVTVVAGATSMTDAPGAGTFSYTLFAVYDETGGGSAERYSAADARAQATVVVT